MKEFSSTLKTPMALYWNFYLEMVDLMLCFIRASREGCWRLHITALRDMLPWFHGYNRTNYARYGALYWSEMVVLEESHPEAYKAVNTGNFAAQRSSSRAFSQTPTDQTIEQTVNRGTKVKGGIIRFSTSQNTVQRWILTAHERASATRNFKSIIGMRDEENEIHADNTASRISGDENNVNKVIQVIKGWCNPFEEVSEFACLSSGLTVDSDIVQGLLGAKDIGETAARDFISKRIVTSEVGFYEALPKERRKTFESASMKRSVMVAGKEEILKADRDIFC